jgi:CubicO group peptidase (beta-lactamase class C family)
MQCHTRIVVVFCLIMTISGSAATPARSDEAGSGPWRQYQTPEQAGFSSPALAQARLFAEQIGSTAVMLVYRGEVVIAWGDITRPLPCASTRKSLLSALYGIAVEKGQIDLETTISALGLDDDQPLTSQEKTARIVDLISSRSGIYIPAAKETASAKRERPARGSHAPGTFWYYNNWDFNVAGVIYERLTGRSIGEALAREIAGPVGMEDFRAEHVQPQYEPSNSRWPAFDVRMSARDFARFGQLFLQQGKWGGRQIVPREWVKTSTSAITAIDDTQGYGYMWWKYSTVGKAHFENARPFWRQDMYAASGHGGHLVLVIPEVEMVIVHRGDNDYSRMVEGRDIWRLAELLWSARTGQAETRPHLADLTSVPFAVTMETPPVYQAIEVPARLLEEVSGNYEMAPGMKMTLRPWNGRLVGALMTGEESEFFASAPDHFFAGPINIEFRVVRDAAGTVIRLDGSMLGKPFKAKKEQ